MRRWTHFHTLFVGGGLTGVMLASHGWLIFLAGFALGAATILVLRLGRRLVYRFDRMLPDAARPPALPMIPADPPKGVQAFRQEQLDQMGRCLSLLASSLPRSRSRKTP